MSGSTSVEVTTASVTTGEGDYTFALGLNGLGRLVRIQKSHLPAGPPGSGQDGDDGAPGSRWFTGTGAPSNSIGAPGDFYLDGGTGNFYGPKSGTWGAAAGSLRGPPGEDGEDGTGGGGGTGTPLTLGNNKLVGTTAGGDVIAVPGTVTIGVDVTGGVSVGDEFYFTLGAPWPGTLDGYATFVRGTSITLNVEKVSGGTETTLGGLSGLVVTAGAASPAKSTNLTGTRAYAAGDALKVTVTAENNADGFALELTFNRTA